MPDVCGLVEKFAQASRAHYPRWYLIKASADKGYGFLDQQVDYLYRQLYYTVEENWRTGLVFNILKATGENINKQIHDSDADQVTHIVFALSSDDKPLQQALAVDLRAFLATLKACPATPKPIEGEPFNAKGVYLAYEAFTTGLRETAQQPERVASPSPAPQVPKTDPERVETKPQPIVEKKLAMATFSNMLGVIEPFSGDSDMYDVGDFISAINTAGSLAELDDREKCHIAKLKLKGPALKWIQSDPDLPALQDWKRFTAALRGRFEPASDSYSISREFQSASQNPGESVAAYASRLQRLALRWNQSKGVPAEADREPRRAIFRDMVLSQFIHGLDPRIRKYVQLQRPKDLDAAVQYAKEEELESLSQGMRGVAIVREESRPSGSRDNRSRGNNGRSDNRRPRNPIRCYRCNKLGSHIAAECRASNLRPQQDGRNSRQRTRNDRFGRRNRSTSRSLSRSGRSQSPRFRGGQGNARPFASRSSRW